MHDALTAESRGIPAAAIMTERFEPSARAVIELNGLAGYPFVVIAHPIASDTDADLRAKAEAAVPRLVSILTGPEQRVR
jgi:hypothetical protein